VSNGKELPILGKTALVTGGAKRLGRAIALELAAAGADVVVHCRGSMREAEAVVAEIRGMRRQAWVVEADLSEASQVESLFERSCHCAGGGLDILVNNASIFPKGRLSELTHDGLDENIRINALAPLMLGRALVKSRRGGCIVNLLDSRMTDYDAEHVAYHLSKRMLFSLTRMMALEFAPRVRVNAVAPGLVLPPPGEDDGYVERLKRSNPLEGRGEPADVAEAVLFLVRGSFITGQVIFVDGGRHMRGAVYG
jgi:NAD(P)-dependent dehydrogenase (short-subunit alcohol dehydrogenase family)